MARRAEVTCGDLVLKFEYDAAEGATREDWPYAAYDLSERRRTDRLLIGPDGPWTLDERRFMHVLMAEAVLVNHYRHWTVDWDTDQARITAASREWRVHDFGYHLPADIRDEMSPQ